MCSEVTKSRAAVDFSPKDSEQVVSESYIQLGTCNLDMWYKPFFPARATQSYVHDNSKLESLACSAQSQRPSCTLQRTWERERKERGNVVTNLLATWEKVHHEQTAVDVSPQEESRDRDSSPEPEEEKSEEVRISDLEDESADSSECASDTGSCGEDIVEDFNLASSEDYD